MTPGLRLALRLTMAAGMAFLLAGRPWPAAAAGKPGAEGAAEAGRSASAVRPMLVPAAALIAPATDEEAEAALADGATEVLIATLAGRGGYRLVGSEEFNRALDLAGRRSSLNCARDDLCLGRAAATLGIVKIFVGVAGKRTEGFVLNLNLIDVLTFKTDRSTIQRARTAEELLTKIPAAVKELLSPVRPARITVVVNVSGAEVRLDGKIAGRGPKAVLSDVTPGEHRIDVSHPGHGSVERLLTVSAGESTELRVVLLAASVSAAGKVPVHKRWWLWTVLAIVAAGGATTLAILLTADRIPPTDGDTWVLE